MDPILISSVTPVYRGRSTLADLVAALGEVRDAWRRQRLPVELTEAIFVDDGSSDGSTQVLAELAAVHPWLRVVTLSRNFGQHPATIAGILHSCGDWVVTLDEDLQHHPRHIPDLLLSAVRGESGLDVVYARPLAGPHGSLVRDLGSRGFKWGLAALTGNPDLRSFNSFRAIRGSVARAAAAVASHDAYFDIVLGWFTNRTGVHGLAMVDQRYAEQGESGYSFRGLLTHARRAMISSQTKWLRTAAMIGLLSLLVSVGAGTYVLLERALDPTSIDVRGWTSLFLAIAFFGGLGSLLLGVILEYLSTLVLRAQGRPTFFVVDRSTDAALRRTLESAVVSPEEAPLAAPRVATG